MYRGDEMTLHQLMQDKDNSIADKEEKLISMVALLCL
jgi:hypothetical protein